MAGGRASKLLPLLFEPGVLSNLADRDATNRYKASNRVRWHKGLPEKIGGWVRQTLIGANNGIYIGVARAVHDWSSLDTQQWIAIGTNCKLYLVNNGRLYDITPMRKASNLANALSVQIGSPTITITDPDHRARTGDHITLTATDPIGGFSVSGVYDIESIPTPDTFTVTFSQNFNATATGGGSVTIEYDISCGLAQNGELLGYGTGDYGEGTYGTPRPVGSGVPARMRTWSLQNWGEDLVASPSDGEFYWWDRTLGPNSRAVLIAEAPGAIQRMLVNPQNRHVLLLGCTGLDGVPDPMRLRWCDQENFRVWSAATTNTAGGKRLDYGSRLVTGLQSRATNYVWSDTQMYSVPYVGPSDIFVPTELGTMKIVGPNACCDVNGVAYSMAFDDFMIYDGTLRPLVCEIHTLIFGDEGRGTEGNFDRTQAEAVYCAPYSPKNEVTWWYPGTDGLIHYATYNTVLDRWYPGTMERTAYHDVSEAITGYKTNPYGLNGGYLYKHEVGTDEVEGSTTTPQDWFLETYDFNVGGSDAIFLTNHLVPNFDRMAGRMRVRLKKKTYPQQQAYQERGPYVLTRSTTSMGVRCKASQMAIRFESLGELGEDWRMGVWQHNSTPYGGRMGVHIENEPPSAVVLSGSVESDSQSGDSYSGNVNVSLTNSQNVGIVLFSDYTGTFFTGREFTLCVMITSNPDGGGTGIGFEFVYGRVSGPALDPAEIYAIAIEDEAGDTQTMYTADADVSDFFGNLLYDWEQSSPPWDGGGVAAWEAGQNYDITFYGPPTLVYFNRLSWTASTPGSAAIAGYRLYNADTDALIEETTALTFDDGPPKADGTYRYYVVAYDTQGSVSAESNVVTLVVSSEIEAPGPVELAGESTFGGVDLSWSASTPGTYPLGSYRVYRAEAGDPFALLVTVDGDQLTYLDTTADPSLLYQYYVVAVDTEGNTSENSNTVQIDPASVANVLLLQADTGELLEHTGVPFVDIYDGLGVSGISTDQIKFGEASYHNQNEFVDHTNYIDARDNVNLTRFAFDGPFTMEGFFYRVSDGGGEKSTLFANSKEPSAGYFFLGPHWASLGFNGEPGDSLTFGYNTSVVNLPDLIMTWGTWHHVAITRDEDDVVRVFLSGVPSATQPVITGTFGGDFDGSIHFTICEGVPFVSADFDGYFDQIRVTRGICRYTAAFTPPTAPFPVS